MSSGLFMVLSPLLALGRQPDEKSSQEVFVAKKIFTAKPKNQKCFCVLNESTNKIDKIKDIDFLYGVVATEMPAKFEPEALKAQAVASYTYFCRLRNENKKRKQSNKNAQDYDFKINPDKNLNYISNDQMHEKWGKNYDDYYGKIKSAVDDVFEEVITKDGELILAAYHAISSGKTEKSKDVFGGDLDYLTNVESPGDKFATNYETNVKVKSERFKELTKNANYNCNFSYEPQNWVRKYERTEGGMVKWVEIGSEKIKGVDVRKIFDLRSANFDISYDKIADEFNFCVKGYGHGVGLSQCGAQYMAANGSSYKQIINWYYPGTKIVKFR